MPLLEEDPAAELERQVLEMADRLDSIERSFRESPLHQLPPLPTDDAIKYASGVQVLASQAVSGATKVVLSWTNAEDPSIDHYEIWATRTAYSNENPYQIAAVDGPPASFTVTADQDTVAVLYVRSIMKSGLTSDLASSPTVAVNIYKLVISTADLADNAVTQPKIADNAVGTPELIDLAVTNAKIGNLAVNDAKVNDLSAVKINAGFIAAARLDVTVAYISAAAMIANAIIGNAHIVDLNASKITAGTMLVTTGDGITVQRSSGTTNKAKINDLGFIVYNGAGNQIGNFYDNLSGAAIDMQDDAGSNLVNANSATPEVRVTGSAAKFRVHNGTPAIVGGLEVSSTNGYLFVQNAGATKYIELFTTTSDLTNGMYVNGSKVVGLRQTGWSAATGTATRTSFDTATVTLAQLAERVKALIDDAISHGLIGT